MGDILLVQILIPMLQWMQLCLEEKSPMRLAQSSFLVSDTSTHSLTYSPTHLSLFSLSPEPMQHFATMQPAAARPHSPPLPSRPPKPAPPQEVYSNLPPMTLDNQPQYPPQPVAMGNQPPQPRLLTNDNYQAGQPVRRQQVNDQYNAGQPAFNAGQPAFNAGPQTNAQQGYGAGVGVPGMDVQRGGVAGVGVAGVGVANMQGMVGPGGQYRAPANAARTGVPDFRAAAKPPPNPPAPDVPSFSDVPETDHGE